MKRDVLNALLGIFPERIPCKETLNHPELIEYVTGINPFENTPLAFKIAWKKSGIDIHVPLPNENVSPTRLQGCTWQEGNLNFVNIGVYPTSTVKEYCPGMVKREPKKRPILPYQKYDKFVFHQEFQWLKLLLNGF
jgi:hypothetical protein